MCLIYWKLEKIDEVRCMLRKAFLLFLPALIVVFSSNLQAEEDIIDPADLLPGSNVIGNFRMDPPDWHSFDATGLYNYMNGAAEIFLEFGIERGVAAE